MLVRSAQPVDVGQTLGVLRRGGCGAGGRGELWWATNAPGGAATVHVRSVAADALEVRAWGPGAESVLATASALVGATDDDGGLGGDRHPLVRDLARRFRGLRFGATGNAFEALVPTVLEQKVQGISARRSYRALVRAYATPAPDAPGAPRLLLPPPARWLLGQPLWRWHAWGVEARRAVTIRTAASYAHRLAGGAGEVLPRLRALPGIGPWTCAEVAATAFGDPDAVSVGDFWLPHWVTHNLAAEPRGTDARMLELLAAWPGQRGRVCRLIMAGGTAPPRYGPRLPLVDIAAL